MSTSIVVIIALHCKDATQSPFMYDSAELDRNIVPIDYHISGASKAYSRTCQS